MEELPVLLDRLKTTVECLSMSSQTSTWEVCGGLDRLHSIMMNIFRHGCLSINSNNKDVVWNFIQGINWLHPRIASLCTVFGNSCPKNEYVDKSSLWIYRSLENHTLSEKLGWLLSDKDHLYKCYSPEAFLCQKAYSNAALLCLKVVELNQPSLLLEIDPKLYLNYSSKNEHCSTLPKSSHKQTHAEYFERFSTLKIPSKHTSIKDYDTSTEHHNNLPRCKIKHLFTKQYHKSWPDLYKMFDRPKLRRSFSYDTMQEPDHTLDYSDLADTDSFTPKLLDVNYEQLLNDNVDSIKHQLLNEKTLFYHSNLSKRIKRQSKMFTLPKRILEESDDDTRSNISDGSKTLIPYDEFPPSKYTGTPGLISSYFPGQDLFKFLSSGQFVQANAELDRENAHFKISEAIIGTIEQIKCNQKLNFTDEIIEESDEEINRLKQRIRCRRRQKLEVDQSRTAGTSSSDCLTESTDHTMSSLTSSYCSTTSSMSTTDDMDEFDLDNESCCSSRLSVCSSSVSSLYSNVDRMRPASSCSSSMVTAESVARSLIRQISHKTNWPVNVNVQWLISERDAPQQILPLPSSWPVNPHEPEDLKSYSRLRGTNDWAPPRPQIIFTCHPSPIRKNLMEQQGYRCAGCSTKVAVKYASKFRYCFYLGRYFCTGCHVNKTATIPGRIIAKWDFSKYPVSCFSFALLEQMSFDPLFNIADLNNSLYKRARGLDRVRSYRLQLSYIKDFIFSCRYADRLKESLETMEAHLILKPDLFSIQNMLDVKSGELGKKLQNVIVICNKHIVNCQLCHARGFVCEICNKNEVLFPWDFGMVTRCMDCGSCYHKKCYVSRKVPMCPRCPRIMAMFKRTHGQSDQDFVVQS